jgi:hypothetical protein
MKMFCPHCGVKGSADDSYIGRMIRCPKCKETFRCQTGQETTEVCGSEEPILPIADENFVSPPVAESSPAESAEEAAAEPPGLSPPEVEEPAAEPETVAAELVEGQPQVPQAEEGVAEEPEATLFEEPPESAGEKAEEIEAEEIQAAYQAEEDTRPVEDVPEPPVEVLVPPENTRQQSPAGIEEEVPESRESQPSPKPEEESAVPAPEAAADLPPLPAEAIVATAAEPAGVTAGPEAPSGALAKGVQPRMDFTLGEALNEAWQYTRGAKGPIWAAVGVMYLIMLLLGLGLGFLQAAVGIDSSSAAGIWAEIGVQTLVSALSTLFTAGLMYMGVRRAAGRPLTWKMIFDGFSMAVKLIIASILMTLLVASGFVLLILPGIYLAVGYTMTLPLMLDRGLDPWQAMETSRKAIHKVWWKVFGLFFVMGLLYLVSTIPLGIGLIWTVPMSVILVGVVYRYLFGVQAEKN